MAATIPASHVDILETAFSAMVTTIRHKDGLPSTNPVSFVWDGEYVRFSTLKQRVKYKNLINNPLLTMCMMDPRDMTRYIEIRGRGEVADDPAGEWNKAIYRQVMGVEFTLDEADAERVIVTLIPEQVSAPLLYGGKLARQ
ncbi:MAG: PPOX class probable F420-dependent enzyme [Bermanella sp.]|jgi:PPOX class probable F420-dependent enzyme